MKITNYADDYNINLSGGNGVATYNSEHNSLGSNTPLVESGSGAPGSGPQASAWDHVHPALGGSSSAFGSNSSRVAAASAAGASSSNSRADHVHDGIGTITASSSNTLLRGTTNLRAGTNVAFALSDSGGAGGFDTLTISSIATGGGGSSGTAIDNWHYEIVAMLGSHGNTNWTTINQDNLEIYAADLESSGAQNDEIYWDIGLSGGTWDLTMLHFKGPNRGIYTISIDGVSIGTVDGYVAVATRNNLATITGITISAGKRRLKLKMATKNASSSNYFGTMSAIQLRRTA